MCSLHEMILGILSQENVRGQYIVPCPAWELPQWLLAAFNVLGWHQGAYVPEGMCARARAFMCVFWLGIGVCVFVCACMYVCVCLLVRMCVGEQVRNVSMVEADAFVQLYVCTAVWCGVVVCVETYS